MNPVFYEEKDYILEAGYDGDYKPNEYIESTHLILRGASSYE